MAGHSQPSKTLIVRYVRLVRPHRSGRRPLVPTGLGKTRERMRFMDDSALSVLRERADSGDKDAVDQLIEIAGERATLVSYGVWPTRATPQQATSSSSSLVSRATSMSCGAWPTRATPQQARCWRSWKGDDRSLLSASCCSCSSVRTRARTSIVMGHHLSTSEVANHANRWGRPSSPAAEEFAALHG